MVISKPVRPPWSDSSKNLVRDIVTHARGTTFDLMGDPGFRPDWPGVNWLSVYGGRGAYAPGLAEKARALGAVLRAPRSVDAFHLFFAPNPASGGALRPVLALKRRPVVHTICSVPRSFETAARWISADVTVALSEYTAHHLREAGVPNVQMISPGIDPERFGSPDDAPFPSRPTLLFAGDYEVGGGAQRLIECAPAVLSEVPGAKFVFACRPKTAAAADGEAQARAAVSAAGLSGSCEFLGEVKDVGGLLRSCTICVLPIDSTWRKMDIPLVLLEAMALGKPVVVTDQPPLSEILAGGGGRHVPTHDAEALAAALVSMLSDETALRGLGAEAASSVRQRWNITTLAGRYEELYAAL
jgi:phosphatidylinositol alpha-1,6-mannosyltransferase